MATFTDVAALIPTLRGQLIDGGDADRARAWMMLMSDADVVRVLEETAALVQQVEQIQVAAAGVIALRSKREQGHSGLSASRGHRSAAAFVQDVTGSTKSDAARKVRVGEALLDDDAAASQQEGPADALQDERPSAAPWYQPLRDALRDNCLTSAQFDAIRRGLGEPFEVDGGELAAAELVQAQREVCDAWAQAAEQLIGEASERTVEELWQQARTIRDLLDPTGAEDRFLERFEKRSFRTYRGQDGQKRASMVLDDDGDLFLETMLASALRPRRGGPRFVDSDEKEQARSLADDPRTNDQLAYDLLMDVLRAGALADAESVFGTRQAGVRLVQTVDADGNRAPVAHSEDNLISVPAAAVDQRLCESGFVPLTIDACGKPLDVGREHRLFTPRQRIALAIRDGGCRWRGCDRPASYCEAHHIDEWARDLGRTDIDRGILLCRYHHMTLHHGGWRIIREGDGDLMLQYPSGERSALRARTVLTYAFGDIDPPPKRFRPAA
ncbi:HNH endonuclease signature motif containing protein [Microbacterium alcoholitolerans]|uniref:HNH endonuclease signature motif containing protein n=1 Tax=unclassified Microbacterium TaxID=2609290 RepID=UPI003D175D5C